MSLQLISFSFETAFGPVTVTASRQCLVSLIFSHRPDVSTPPPIEFASLVSRLQTYFDGRKVCFDDIKLDLSSATPFQIKVWQATRSIPYGETRSYRWVAEQTGKPAATRAVGQALGKNPLPIIIPCHRVITSTGGFGGYSGGLEMKHTLLRLEKVTFATVIPSR
ncbi:MAG: methylated-DNA--[protein]-cysteine S-methyltransferase [Dehalococcoidales bacterium]|nr:methylated-DNA--[protein]-cysteine S-methyltransferase [Dehalococcoidales bacterium]